MTVKGLLVRIRYRLVGLVVFVIIVSALNIRMYMKRAEETLNEYKAITDTYRTELIRLVRQKQPANTKIDPQSLEQNAHAELLQKFKARASHVTAQCKKLTPEELDSYKTQSYDAYDPYWWGEIDEEKKVTEAPKKSGETEIIFHFDFREHGPSGVVPAYNLLISAPEKCASEFWFRIMEFLNFPQVSWPRGQTDKKHYQMRYMLPMVHEIEGAAQSIATKGSTLAIVRHPLLRLVSAYSGFFTKSALNRDRNFAKWWLEQSPAFQELLDENAQIRNNNIQIREDQNAPIDFMTFAQFIEGILIHLRSAESAKYRLRWNEQGEDHISPLFAILQPCHYPFQYYIKVENLGPESREFFTALSIDVPEEYLLPSHESDPNHNSPQAKVKKYYHQISTDHLKELKKFYSLDLNFFGYNFDPITLEISY